MVWNRHYLAWDKTSFSFLAFTPLDTSCPYDLLSHAGCALATETPRWPSFPVTTAVHSCPALALPVKASTGCCPEHARCHGQSPTAGHGEHTSARLTPMPHTELSPKSLHEATPTEGSSAPGLTCRGPRAADKPARAAAPDTSSSVPLLPSCDKGAAGQRSPGRQLSPHGVLKPGVRGPFGHWVLHKGKEMKH